MPTNLGFTLNIKANNGNNVPLMPETTRSQIIDYGLGDILGPYPLTLSVTGWTNGVQTLSLPGITSTDIPYCLKILSGTQEEMQAQDRSYTMIDQKQGIESLNGQVRFYLRKPNIVPTVDINVQVYWTR